MSCNNLVSFEVIDIRAGNVRVFDEAERSVVQRADGPSVRYEGRFYQLFHVPGAPRFIDLARPCGRC